MKFENNPLQASLLNIDKNDLEKKGHPESYENIDIVKDKEGRVFYGGEHFKEGPNQMMMVKMLKGIMPVSDVVFAKDDDGKGHFYSYQIPLIDSKDAGINEQTLAKMEVDALLLNSIFHDKDHTAFKGYKNKITKDNVRIEGEKYVFFDFSLFESFWLDKPSEFPYMNPFDSFCDKVAEISESEKRMLSERLDQLQNRFQGEDGLQFLHAIIDSIPVIDQRLTVIDDAPGTDKIKSFQEELLKRIKQQKEYLADKMKQDRIETDKSRIEKIKEDLSRLSEAA